MGISLDDISDKDLYERLENSALADRLESDPAWGLVKKAAERIVDRAVADFAIKCDPSDMKRIIQLQTILKKYKYGLFEEIRILKTESDFLFEEVKERGMVGAWLDKAKEKIGL